MPNSSTGPVWRHGSGYGDLLDESGELLGPEALRTRPDLRRLPHVARAIAAYDGPECSLADWMQQRGYSPLARRIIDIRLAHAWCATPATISMHALARELREAPAGSDGGDFRIVQGYDHVLATISAGLDIHTASPVTLINWSPEGVMVQVANGTQWHARAAVVTLPLAVLQAGVIEFDPPLPSEKRQAINGLAMRPALKVLLRFDECFWPARLAFLSARSPLMVWWSVRRGQPLLTGFATADLAVQLRADGRDAAIERAIQSLEQIFGASVRRHLRAAELVDWADDRWARGGYSSVPVGADGLRTSLAAPLAALYFAGEATVTHDDPATVHGALGSGERAAREVMQSQGMA